MVLSGMCLSVYVCVCVYLFLISRSGMYVGVACAGECVCVSFPNI